MIYVTWQVKYAEVADSNEIHSAG